MKLKEFLEKTPEVRKIFGKGELVIIKKQLGGVGLTQSEKNRLSRDIRAKFRLIKELAKFSEEFDLKKGAENKKLIENAKEVILEDKFAERINSVWLFGSILENRMSIRSDVDIAVSFNKISKKEAVEFRKRVLGKVFDKLDIQVFNVLPEKIKRSILKKHRILYNKDGK